MAAPTLPARTSIAKQTMHATVRTAHHAKKDASGHDSDSRGSSGLMELTFRRRKG